MAKQLLSSTTRVEVPYVKVTIGDYTFGVYSKTEATRLSNGFYVSAGIKYPNYIQRLDITKVNGELNTYNLSFIYTIRPGDDPNFFEKVFSSVSSTREIVFSYGDISAPQYIYKNEKALILQVSSRFSTQGKIEYNVSAISSSKLSNSTSSYYPARTNVRPSSIIKSMLKDPSTGLLSLFTGMANFAIIDREGLIESDDIEVNLKAQINYTPLQYIKYLVSCMIPSGTSNNKNQIESFYAFTIHDEAEGEVLPSGFEARNLGGPYFRVRKVSKNIEHPDAYDVIIGYPTANLINSFNITNDENYSLLYDYQGELNESTFVRRLDMNGNWVTEYSPVISSKNKFFTTTPEEKTWWSKITQYPISASLSIKGLLRPALLMEYVNLQVLFFGKKHISSGLYIITKQVDSISGSGYSTTLSLTKIQGDPDLEVVEWLN